MLYIMTAQGWMPWYPSYKICDNHNKLEGVYVNTTPEEVQRQLQPRIARFLAANGIGNLIDKNHHFRGDHFNEPLRGAFGEKL